MQDYQDLIQRKISQVYQTGVSTKILQLMDRIRNVSDLTQSRRWVMELLQNARDTAWPDRPVRVRITLEPESLTFEHSGRPFRVKDILSILNQVSSKSDDDSAVGQFGTGFMSTFQLSETVELASVLRDTDPDTGEALPDKPFQVTLDRSGHSSEAILAAITASVDQLRQVDSAPALDALDPDGFNTRFTYRLDTPTRRVCAETGVRDLQDTILYIMLFSQTLGQVEVRTPEGCRLYQRGELTRLTTTLDALTIRETRDDETRDHSLLCTTREGLTLALSWDRETKALLPLSPNTPRLFVDFPLIGAENFPFPVVLNHRGLQPNEPRSGVTLVDNETSLDAKANKAILDRAVALYADFLPALHALGLSGLEQAISIPAFQPSRELSEPWVREHLYRGLFRTVEQLPFLFTTAGPTALRDPRVQLLGGETPEERRRVLDLADGLKDCLVPLDGKDWATLLSGYELPPARILTLEGLTGQAESILRNGLMEQFCSPMGWLRLLYEADMENPTLALRITSGELRLFPNQDPEEWKARKLLSIQEVYGDPGIPEILKDASDQLDRLISSRGEHGLRLRKELLHRDFGPVDRMAVYEETRLTNYLSQRSSRRYPVVNFALNRGQYLEAWQQAWMLLLSCDRDRTLYDLWAKQPGIRLPEQTVLPKEYDPSLWRNSCSGVSDLLLNFVESCTDLRDLGESLGLEEAETLDWLNGLLAIADRYTDALAGRRVFPNQQGEFLTGNLLTLPGSELTVHLLRDETAHEELKAIAQLFADLDPACGYARYVCDRRLHIPQQLTCSALTDAMAAGRISNCVTQLLNQASLSETSPDHQAACSRLMQLLMQEDSVSALFPQFAGDEDRMKLLTPGEAVKLHSKAQELQKLMEEFGVETPDELKALLDQIRKSPKSGLVLWMDRLGSEYADCGSQQEFEDLCREIGAAGEQYALTQLLKEAEHRGWTVPDHRDGALRLEKEGQELAIEGPDSDSRHQPGWDIHAAWTNDAGDRQDWYIEVKTHTCTSRVRGQIRLSPTQLRLSCREGERYVVALTDYSRAAGDCVGLTWLRDPIQCLAQGALACEQQDYLFRRT